jgi:putative ABC transport system permease protein
MPERPLSPDWRAEVRARLASAGLHPQDEAELAEEMAQHLDEQFADLAPSIGAEAARAQLTAQLRDSSLDEAISRRRRRARPPAARTWSSGSIWRDVRYGLRSLRRSPGVFAAGTAALALGIGLTTMMFSILYGAIIKGLPFDDPSRIAYVSYNDPRHGVIDGGAPLGDYQRFAARQRSFETFGGLYRATATLTGADRPERIEIARMTAGVFEMLETRPMLGRFFVARDNQRDAEPTAVLGYSVWRDRYASDSAVLGRAIRLNGKQYTVIGVMPEKFQFPDEARIWLPLQLNASLAPGDGPSLNIVGRLRPGVDYESANVEFRGLMQQLDAERSTPTTIRPVVLPYVRATMPKRVYTLLYSMLAAVILVLLVACANVTNLLLDRTLRRSREIGIRTALGATRLAVVRQSFVESAILAGLAAIVGTALAHIGIVLFNGAFPAAERRFWMDIRLHPAVLVFVVSMAILATLVSGLLPAIQSTRLDVGSILKDESHSTSSLRVGRLSRLIVAFELALSSALLVGAGFLTKSVVKLRNVEPGFVTASVFTAQLTAAPGDSLKQRAFFESVDRELNALSGVEGAYLGSGLPGRGLGSDRFAVEGRTYQSERDYGRTRTLAITPRFFTTFGVHVLKGRGISADDRLGTPGVAVVNEAFVRQNFRGGDAIGRRIRLGGGESKLDWVTIVGVVPTLYTATIDDPFPPAVITALWQRPQISSVAVAVRGPADVASAPAVRKVIASLDPEIPLYATSTMSEELRAPMWPLQLFGNLFIVFGIVSLVLATIGLYAVMAFSASRRVRELGIRMALGASGRDVIGLVSRQGARQIVVGVTIGVLIGTGFVRLIRAVLFDVQPNDPWVFALVVGVLGSSAFVACLVPALRAGRVDPVIALRSEQ